MTPSQTHGEAGNANLRGLGGTTVGVIGAGTMGIGIAYVFAAAGAEVTVVEPDDQSRQRARRRLDELVDDGVARHRLDRAAAMRIRAVALVEDVGEIGLGSTVIIEAVPEDGELKRRVLASSETREPTVLATNTSSLALAGLMGGLSRPERLIGMHFFNPVWASRLVEVVRSTETIPHVVDITVDVVRRLDKTPIVVADRPGFASSRLGVLLGFEAIRMLEEGVACAADIDTAMTLGYGHPMGPLRLTDLVGLDVRLAIGENLARSYGERFEPPRLLRELVAAGRLGKKTGQGFFDWSA